MYRIKHTITANYRLRIVLQIIRLQNIVQVMTVKNQSKHQ